MMIVSANDRRLLELCAIRVDGKSPDWSTLARAARAGGLDAMLTGVVPDAGPSAARTEQLLRIGLAELDDASERVQVELEAAESVDARLITVLDDDYPANLRLVDDLPPFLFVRGTITDEDLRAVAVVGTRNVSDLGRSRAGRMAKELVASGVTVASGLAKGVDTAAHTAALDAGGRTIAVVGTGITRCYPAENRDLAERIVGCGAVVSQFWPTRSPGRDTFPRRNRVTSGISQGTVVIEASSTSGAKMQARLAYEHGKRVWLIQSLVTDQPWARKMVSDGRAKEISATSEVIADLKDQRDLDLSQPTLAAPAEVQLALDLG